MFQIQFASALERGARQVKQRAPKLYQGLKNWAMIRALYAAWTSAPGSASAGDVNVMLHQLRSAHLRRMPRIEGVLLSAGCAGLWYFDWIRQCTGHTGRHIGIEYYTPKPDNLPGNVEWIANTVGNMEAVGNEL